MQQSNFLKKLPEDKRQAYADLINDWVAKGPARRSVAQAKHLKKQTGDFWEFTSDEYGKEYTARFKEQINTVIEDGDQPAVIVKKATRAVKKEPKKGKESRSGRAGDSSRTRDSSRTGARLQGSDAKRSDEGERGSTARASVASPASGRSTGGRDALAVTKYAAASKTDKARIPTSLTGSSAKPGTASEEVAKLLNVLVTSFNKWGTLIAESRSPEFRSALQDPIQAYTLLKSRVDALEAQKHAMQDLRLALRQSEQDVRDHVQACDNLRSELVRAKQTISRLQMENKRLSVFAQSAQGQDNAVVGK
ncbi:hypothetical protein BD626DRAFT_576181 [Schizophyllum amplum]|uniref:Uncharacterized protein n=1 Tax=Schizophyllum amplum TaxID=97359 RepID=A0A550BTZ3_9AGAR|nr:hypothetical protein BD626DRAFT_576181 [Auriculariopsis ampla]